MRFPFELFVQNGQIVAKTRKSRYPFVGRRLHRALKWPTDNIDQMMKTVTIGIWFWRMEKNSIPSIRKQYTFNVFGHDLIKKGRLYAIAFCRFSSTLSRKPSVVSHF